MRRLPLVFIFLLGAIASAQNAAPSAEPGAAPHAEMQKWLDTVDAQWQGTFKLEVTAPYEQELAKLRQQYRATVDASFAKASGAGDLDLTVAWRAERDRLASAKEPPERDEDSEPAPIKAARAAYRDQVQRLEKERGARARQAYTRYDQVLAQAQTQLTQRQRIEDALLVKNKREQVAREWLAGVTAAPVAKPEPREPAGKPLAASPATPKATPTSDKLAILSASYGETSSNRMIDTTEHLQKVFESGQKTLKLNTRDGAEGKDPAPAVRKETVITYTIHGQTKTKTFPEAYDLNFKADLK